MGQYDDGYRHAQRGHALNPRNAVCIRMLAAASLLTGRNDEAIEVMEAFERLTPGTSQLPPAIAYKAIAHAQAGRFDDACQTVERAFGLKPDDRVVLVARAAICALADRSQKASDSIRQIRRLSPDTPLDLLLDNVVSFATSHGAPLRAAFIKVWDETPVEGER